MGVEKLDTIRDRLISLLGIEPLISISLLCIAVYFIYRVFLKKVTKERHENLKKLFRELFTTHLAFMVAWSAQFAILQHFQNLDAIFPYFGIATVILGAISFVRSVKILVFEYLFINSMTVGVPVLLVNLVTLILSIFIAAWLSTTVFGVRWAPLLATSAIVSVVLGLALQETLGNLFAGVALQFDKPYEIGDWIELHSSAGNGETFVGEVNEITWRSTVLFGLYDEVLTLPNRLVAQSEISNYSSKRRPVFRGLNIVVDANADEDQVRAIFTKVLKETKGVIQTLDHIVMLRELTEKGALWRLYYPIEHFKFQFIIIDEILMRSQRELKAAGISTSRLRVSMENQGPQQSGVRS